MNEINPYSTHLDVLKLLVDISGKPQLCIEFGMGDYSTGFLIENSHKLISIEMQSNEWYEKMLQNFKSFDNWSPILSLGPHAYEKLNLEKPTLCFVDGHGESRPECVNMMIKSGCPIIVAHDTEQPSYGWDRIDNKNYYKIDFKKHVNWTTVWVSEEKLYNHLLSKI